MQNIAHEYHSTYTLMQEALHHAPFWLSLAGIITAWFIYIANPGLSEKLSKKLSIFVNILKNEYGIEKLYDLILVRPCLYLSNIFMYVFDQGVIDRILVVGSGKSVAFCGRLLRRLQTGYVNDYVLAMITGLIVLMILFK